MSSNSEGRILRNEAYVGRVYFDRTEVIPATNDSKPTRQRPRPKEEWIAIPVPLIIPEDVFDAAQRVSRDNSKWSPRKATPSTWLNGDSSCAAPAASAQIVIACVDATARGITIATVATTTRSEPAVRIAAAPNATSPRRARCIRLRPVSGCVAAS